MRGGAEAGLAALAFVFAGGAGFFAGFAGALDFDFAFAAGFTAFFAGRLAIERLTVFSVV
jgi:hypothetical protein